MGRANVNSRLVSLTSVSLRELRTMGGGSLTDARQRALRNLPQDTNAGVQSQTSLVPNEVM